jgi:hypothetical protein
VEKNLSIAMKLLSLFAGCSIAAVTLTSVAYASVWKSFTSKDGGFSILLPGQPTIIEEQVKTGKVRKFVAENLAQGTVYMVIYSSKGTNDFQMIAQNGRMVSQRSISLQSYRGQERIYESAKDIIKHRTYFAGQRVYQVVASIDKQKYKHLARSTEGFLNSFRITKKATRQPIRAVSASAFTLSDQAAASAN